MDENYWKALDDLVAHHGFTTERARGSAHPRFPEYIYPLDYGFIPDTISGDGAEIDAWMGSQNNLEVTGIATTFDAIKKIWKSKF